MTDAKAIIVIASVIYRDLKITIDSIQGIMGIRLVCGI